MGIFNKIFGGADGVRETVKDTYIAQKEACKKQGTRPEDIEQWSLYGVLGSRYIARGRPQSEVSLMTEVQPFSAMNKQIAISMLAEYIVFQEMPQRADVSRLAKVLNEVIDRTYSDDKTKSNLAVAFLTGIKWCELLDDKNLSRLQSYMSGSKDRDVNSAAALVVNDKTELETSKSKTEKFKILEKVTPKGDGSINKKACLQCGAESFENDYLKSSIGDGWLRCPICNMNFQDG